MLTVYTGHVASYRGSDGLDVTIKTAGPAGRPFAPDSWDMVLGAKRGTVSPDAYATYYRALMVESQAKNPDAWTALLARTDVTLLCYCGSRFLFCHRRLLAQILTGLGARYAGER